MTTAMTTATATATATAMVMVMVRHFACLALVDALSPRTAGQQDGRTAGQQDSTTAGPRTSGDGARG